MKHIRKIFLTCAAFMAAAGISAQEKVVPLSYGNMDSWTIRKVHESAIIGGNTKTLYEIGPNRTVEGNKPYTNGGGSPWARQTSWPRSWA